MFAEAKRAAELAGKERKGRGKKGRQQPAFDPHASIQELKFKKEPRPNVTPKTGQRSMTFAYKKYAGLHCGLLDYWSLDGSGGW